MLETTWRENTSAESERKSPRTSPRQGKTGFEQKRESGSGVVPISNSNKEALENDIRKRHRETSAQVSEERGDAAQEQMPIYYERGRFQ